MKKPFLTEDRLMVHDWLKYHPSCIKFLETLMQQFDDLTCQQLYFLIAEYWRWDIYPEEHHFCEISDDVKHIATHLIYYFQFIKSQRHKLPEAAEIPVTNLYLKCYAITHGERSPRKSDPSTIPDQYRFLQID